MVFDIPSRSVGQRVRSNGHYAYPVRRGESLGEMDDVMTREILNEVEPDFSALVCIKKINPKRTSVNGWIAWKNSAGATLDQLSVKIPD